MKHLAAQRVVALFFLGLITVSMVQAARSPVARALSRGERVPVLVFGVDAADLSQHTDTLMVTLLDPVQNFLSVLSIPRDTRVELPGYRFRRVNEIYGYHFRRSRDRSEATLKVLDGVQHLLLSDVRKVALPHFMQLDYGGFRKLVDLVDGVWVSIKEPMHYDDNAGNYHFHREPGRILMRGQEALFYVRFRGPTGDRGRILRQQEFSRNLVKRFANPLMVLRFPKMVAAVSSSLYTNLSGWDVIYLLAASRRLRAGDIGFYILPGTPRGSYWYLKQEAKNDLVSLLLFGKPYEEPEGTIRPEKERISVKVWNASGRRGVAYRLTKVLRRRGYDVVDWGNYTIEQIPTRIVDRRGNIANAQAVANDLGVENYHSEPNARSLVDVEVIVGRSYGGIK